MSFIFFYIDTYHNYVPTFVLNAISPDFDKNFIWYNKRKQKKISAFSIRPRQPYQRLHFPDEFVYS